MSKDDFLSDWIANRQAVEIDLLNRIEPHVVAAPGNLWMITLVSKEDLWWHQREFVRRHYQQGAYGDAIQRIEAARGRGPFRHEYISAATVMQNFMSGTGQLLLPTASGYDDERRHDHLRKLVGAVDVLATRK